MLKDKHSQKGLDNSIEITSKSKIEVSKINTRELFNSFSLHECSVQIEFQTERNKDAWNNQIS